MIPSIQRLVRTSRVAVVAFAAAGLSIVAADHGAWAQSGFYDASPAELAGRPGTVIRKDALSGAPLGAAAYRVLYRSIGLKGEPIAVSGVVVIPAAPTPAGGMPIVAWGHPTTGIIPRCAPSLAMFVFQQMQGLRDMVERGYIVTATDYPGLGTPGPHPYLVGTSEGRAVLDSIRAARELAGAAAGRRAAVWGHSQGGQAVLYATLLQKTYAPDIDLVGVAAAAPATELGVLMRDDLPTPGGKNLLAMTLWSWARVFDAPIDKVVDPEAMPAVDKLASLCLESPIDIFPRGEVGKELQKQFLTVNDLTDLEPWRAIMAENTIGILPHTVPVFLAQGTTDDTISPAVTHNYMDRLCSAGSRVKMLVMPDVGHGTAAMRSATTAVAWMADRFAGAPAPSDCGAP